MANKFYQSGLASGANDGTTWANAWQTMQKVLDSWAGSDDVFCDTLTNGAEVLSVLIDDDTVVGTQGGYLSLIAVNGDQSADPWDDVDGTPAILDANSAVANVILTTGARSFRRPINIEMKNSTAIAYSSVGSDFGCIQWGCNIHDAGDVNFHAAGNNNDALMLMCKYSSASSYGIRDTDAGLHFACELIGNGNTASLQNIVGATAHSCCVFHGNTNYGVSTRNQAYILFNTFDANSHGGFSNSTTGPPMYLFNRFTNMGWGVSMASGKGAIVGYNAYFNLSSGIYNTAGNIILLGDDIVLTVEGYNDEAGDDFTLTDAAEARRDALLIGGPAVLV